MRPKFWASLAGTAVGAVAYVLTLLDYRWAPARSANALGYASNFFDFQARALMDGNLYVADGALGIEAFRHDGHQYAYFGPWPALLRIPILWTTDEFDGRLTVLSMAVAFGLMIWVTNRLAWLVRDLVRPDTPVGWFEGIAMALMIALALGGTSLTYVASLPWVYHEVYAWQVPLALGTAYWLIRVQVTPHWKTVGWLLCFVLAISLTRSTGGWAACLGALLVAGRLWFVHRDQRRVAGLTAAVGVLCFLVGIGINLAKFGHPFLFPLEDQVWTELSARRREALAINGGTITGMQFFTTSFFNYFRLDGIRFVDYFPYLTLPAEPAQAVGDAFLDQSYRTGSVTSFMPVLLLCSVLGALSLFRRLPPQHRVLRIPLFAMVFITAGVMNYGYIAHRYTAEFVPALVLGAFVFLPQLVAWLAPRARSVKLPVLTVLALGTAFSIAAQMLVGFSASKVTFGGYELANYLAAQHARSPDRQAKLISQGTELPGPGKTDQIYIRGDCDELYFHTGDAYDQWVLVERKNLLVKIRAEEKLKRRNYTVFDVQTYLPREVKLRTRRNGKLRLELHNEGGAWLGPWLDLRPAHTIRIGFKDIPEYGFGEVGSNPGGFLGYLRTFDWDTNWERQPTNVTVGLPPFSETKRDGLYIRVHEGAPPPVCSRLLDLG